MKKILTAVALLALVSFAQGGVIFTSNFDGNTGAYVFSGNTDNTAGSSSVAIVDWTTGSMVTSISGLTAISTTSGGFAQLQGGTATYAGPDNIYLSRNHNLDGSTSKRGFSLTFTLNSTTNLSTLTVLSGHTTNTGTQDQSYSSTLVYSLSGGTLGAALTGSSSVDYGISPAYHSVVFDLTGTSIGAGTYTLEIYQTNLSGGGAYAIYDGITLEDGALPPPPPPTIGSFTASPATVDAGGSVTLSWSTTNADTLRIDQGIGEVTGTTSTQVVVTADTTYTLIAENAYGSTTSAVPVTVNLYPPTIQSFTASPASVANYGDTVTLSWQVSDAATLAIDQGVGEVTGTSTQVVVNAATTYTLTATNSDGTDTAGIRVSTMVGQPNIVLFLVDDMGPHDTSVPFNLDTNGVPVAYGFNDFYVTPNMESLAADGMRFTSAYAQSVCSPTRCGIMTGHNSARHAVTDWVGSGSTGVPVNWRSAGLDASDTTLPKLLKLGGYRSIHVGKAHFAISSVDVATDLGFDVNIAGGRWGHPPAGYIGTPGYGLPGLEAYDGSLFLTKALTIEANKALEDAVDDDVPFFLNMAFYAVHAPFTTNPDATGDYSAATGDTHAKFATMIEGMDMAVGEIRQKLVDLGVAEETLIVFVGDNGSDSPATNVDTLPDGIYSDFPMRGMKGSKWEGGIRVPMIACWGAVNPNNAFQQAIPIPANSIETDLVATWDLPVTFLNIAGLAGAVGFGDDGHDLTPYFSATPGTHRPQEIVVHYPHNHRSDFFSLIRQGDMKLIYNYQSNSHQLYNLADDPTESNNLATSDPNTLTRMARALAQQLDSTWGSRGVLTPTIATTAPNGNVVSIPNDPLVDVDGDGLADTLEDPDLDGLVALTETDPDNDNTDGDGTPDGAEVRTGTDPLDPESDFVGEWVSEAAGGFTATWPSAPGAVYEIQTTDDLTDWSDPPIATGIPASDPGTTTSHTVPASGDLQRFYRIALLP
jgi:arylsulfatase A-like enzyme